MPKSISPRALLRTAGESNLPVLELDISEQFQFCVDAGVAAASELLIHLPSVTLHDHVSLSLSAFRRSVEIGLAATGDAGNDLLRACVDAFTVGYLGHLQRHLMQSAGMLQASTFAGHGSGIVGHA